MNRSNSRLRLTVEHLHRESGRPPTAVISELAYLHGEPKAILGWIDLGGARTPICVDLDPAKLTAAGDARRSGRFTYAGTTVDPGAHDAQADPAAEPGR